MNILGLDINRYNIGVALLVVALGMLTFNQAIGFYYKVQLLKEPCALCLEYNSQLEECFYGQPVVINYTKPSFNWSSIKLEEPNVTG